MKTLVYETKVE